MVAVTRPPSYSNYGLCVRISTHFPRGLFPDTAIHCVASFQVKNNGHIDVFVFLEGALPTTVPPHKTSPPFTASGHYVITSEFNLNLVPRHQILVDFSPGKTFDVKTINSPSLDVEIILKFDPIEGDLISSLSPVKKTHYF